MTAEFKSLSDSIASGLFEMGDIPFRNHAEQIPPEKRPGYIVPVRTSVGCPSCCSFCYRPFPNWHGLPAERVAVLFDFYTSKGFSQFLLSDENFIGTDLIRAHVIADHLLQIKTAHPRLSFEFDVRADSFGDYQDGHFDHELVDKFKRAGVFSVFTGIEAGNTDDLAYYRKFGRGVDALKQNIFYLTTMREHGVNVESGFIMLNEKSDLNRVRKNIAFIHDYLPAELVPEIYWYRISYYSGSELTRRKIKELTLAGDNEALRKIAYGELRVNFNRPEIQRFAAILDSVKTRFLQTPGGFDFELRDRPDLLARIGDQVKEIHTSHFNQYADIAEAGSMADIPVLVDSHYQIIRSLCV